MDKNIVEVRAEDRSAIEILTHFPFEKRMLVKGFILGLNSTCKSSPTTINIAPEAPKHVTG